MPIYEFLCPSCNTLLNFFSPVVDTDSVPACPHCSHEKLERRPARFATLKHRGEGDQEPFGDLDDERLESAMASMMGEFENMGDSEDPRVLAKAFRKMGDATGYELGPRMEEMLGRLESGEDPDLLEEELGDQFDDEEGVEEFFRLRKSITSRTASSTPRVDEKLYFL